MVFTVRLGDRENVEQPDWMPVMLILDNLRSAYNVGNLFRAAEATRAMGIVTCGYTATPPHIKLQKTARGCDETVPCEHFEQTTDAITAMKARGFTVYGVDTVEDAAMYWDAEFQFPCAFVMGNEALGISGEALKLCDGFVKLPAIGMKNSINVGNCGAVILFECVRRYWHRFGQEGGLSVK